MDIDVTRTLVHAALSGQLVGLEYDEDPLFHILVPRSCPGVDPRILNPRNTWDDKEACDRRATKLAHDFCTYFDTAYGSKGIAPAVVAQCPGK
jgi:phosphoenolpyruvate carboxykinase (ATP)